MSTRPTPGADDDRAELPELLATLVAFDSVNPSLVPAGAGEQQIARFAAAWLTTAGPDVRSEESAPGRPSVIARRRGTGGGRTLLLLAHTDTVGVAGMDRPHQPLIEAGRLRGRGACHVLFVLTRSHRGESRSGRPA